MDESTKSSGSNDLISGDTKRIDSVVNKSGLDLLDEFDPLKNNQQNLIKQHDLLDQNLPSEEQNLVNQNLPQDLPQDLFEQDSSKPDLSKEQNLPKQDSSKSDSSKSDSSKSDSSKSDSSKSDSFKSDLLKEENLSNKATQIKSIDQTKLESVNFSQTNTVQTSDDQLNLLNKSKVDYSTQINNLFNLKQDKQIQLDPNELSNKLIDLRAEEASKAKELSRMHLPDLVSSTEKQPETDLNKATTTDDEIPSYQVKWIKFRNKECGIIMQNVNGCCPLLAIMNVLLLRGKIQLPLSTKIVTYDEMIVFLANFILENGSHSAPEGLQLDYEQNINDAMQLFPKLQTGLDVNVQFNSITSFEYTSEMIIFDLLGISLYHGWILDKEDIQTTSVIGNFSYNQLVDKIITNKSSNKSEEVSEALIAERFLENTASQLTYIGLSELVSNVREQELSILFRNNHFITLYKNQNQLYQLVTDQGFLQEPDVVWMTLSHIDNDDQFLNCEFKPSTTKSNTLSPNEQKKQIDQDYLLALCMEEEEKKNAILAECSEFYDPNVANTLIDEEFARRLQEEEDLKEIEEIERNKLQNRMKSSKCQVVEQDSYLKEQRNDRIRNALRDQYKNTYRDQQQQFNQNQHPQLNCTSENLPPQTNKELLRINKRSTNSQMNSTAPSENHTQSSSSRHSRSNSNHHTKSKCIIS